MEANPSSVNFWRLEDLDRLNRLQREKDAISFTFRSSTEFFNVKGASFLDSWFQDTIFMQNIMAPQVLSNKGQH